MKDRDRPGCITKQVEVARAEAWPTNRKPDCRQRNVELPGGHTGCDYFGHILYVVFLGTVWVSAVGAGQPLCSLMTCSILHSEV